MWMFRVKVQDGEGKFETFAGVAEAAEIAMRETLKIVKKRGWKHAEVVGVDRGEAIEFGAE